VGEKSTETNLVAKFGTPAYMAPEAIECCPNIDGRTDVYGFGVLFFETLTGTLPFVGDPGPDLFARILTDPPPKVTAHRPDLSAEVAHIIDCALAKNANDRFPDVDHFIRAVEDHLLPPPLMARSLSPIAGVSLFRLGETNSGPSIPTASAANHKGPVGRIQRNETVALYSMMGESSHAAGKAEVTQRKNWAGKWADKWVEWIGTVFKNLWRLPHQRAALGATFTALLILTAWLALSSSSRSRGLGNGQSSSSSQPSALDPGPVITPLPTAASPAPAVANQLGVPAAPIDNVQATVQPAPAQTGATPPTRTATPATSSRRSIAAVAPPASNRVFRKGATTRRHRTGTSVPRAGRLSPSDF
jgi:serine/threonine protein kinase